MIYVADCKKMETEVHKPDCNYYGLVKCPQKSVCSNCAQTVNTKMFTYSEEAVKALYDKCMHYPL